MNRPVGRVLTLLELLQSGGVRPAAELADRLGVDTRTVRRYVDHLLNLDIPVESVRGRYGGYRLARGFRLPPLMLGDDEALAVLLGLLSGRRSGLTATLGPAGETAAAKIRRVLPARLADRLDSVLESIAFTGEEPDQSAAPDATVLLTISDAVTNRRPIAIAYGDRTDRTVHPYAIVSHGKRWYVRALDPVIGEERTFRLDRIHAVRTMPGTFDPPGDDPVRSLVTGFATAEYRHQVALRIQGTAEQIRTRFPASVATLQPLADEGRPGWHRLAIRAERLDWLPATLAALDLPFEIERPAELRDLVLALAERLASRARGGA
ncbi:helix-turn-helix transcriptional regulator [Catenulispora rubra]|uniref:helix-turn-helix transcriptional regulator n=1 Tax=Catenulispora rubra TaxID=280293 RepID=UPI0018924BB0|nr:YafY family protein [Catenulispora rubra]